MKGNLRFLSLLILSCSLFPINAFADRSNRIAFDVLDSGSMSGVDHQMIMVADTAMLFEHLWHMHKMDGMEPVPYVDFEKEIVVAHFMGNSASCGYDIEITKIKEKEWTVQVKSEITVPAAPIQCLIAEQPYEIIKMPRTTKILSFKQSVEAE